MKKNKLPKSIRLGSLGGTLCLSSEESQSDGPHSFEMVAYTGAAMEVFGWPHAVVVDLNGLEISSKSRPILRDHSSEKIVGHTTEIKNDKSVLSVSGVISGTSTDAQEVVSSSRNGFPWQASIGARVERTELLKEGAKETINGQQFTGPLVIARKTKLSEVSFVALGADDDTSARVAASETRGENMDPEFIKWLESRGFVADDLSPEQTASLTALYNQELKAQESAKEDVDQEDVIAEIRAKVAKESERIHKIKEVCKDNSDIEAKAIKEGWTPEAAELEVLRATRPSAPNIQSRDSGLSFDTLEAAVFQASGIDLEKAKVQEKSLDAADKIFKGQIGLQELLLEAARLEGYVGRSFRSDSKRVLQAAFSTLSLPGILSNVANKFLLQGFESVENTWSRLTATTNVRDFKEITSYRLTGDFVYEEVGPDGELKHAEVGEESYTNQAKTYGRMFSITRHDLINDDLGALTNVPRRIGRGAALKLNLEFWTRFLANSTFFEASKNNFLDGAVTALDIDSLTLAEELFFEQIDPDGQPLAVNPAILLVPNGLNAKASQLMRSAEVMETGNTDRTFATSNPHAGKFTVERSSYLSNTTIPGSSAVAWYLLANPQDLPVIEVAFLNGQQTPIVETADADFNVLGIQLRGYHDFGVALQEHRGGVKMKGEA